MFPHSQDTTSAGVQTWAWVGGREGGDGGGGGGRGGRNWLAPRVEVNVRGNI